MQTTNQFGGPNASPKGVGKGSSLLEIAWLGASVVGAFMRKGKKEKNATKLDDLRVSSSTYGKGIPVAFGTMKVTGNMIWSTDFREIKHIIGKKGEKADNEISEKKVKKGAAQEVYEYRANFAMGMCAGVMDDILRIWADNNLIFDRHNPDKQKKPGFSQPEQQNSGKNMKKDTGTSKSGEAKWVWRFYAGTEDQMPDPYMAAVQGPTKVPAYRGLCYIMFEDFPVKDFGNRIPSITAELVSKTHRRVELKPFLKQAPDSPHANGIRFYEDCTNIVIDPTRYEIIQYTNTSLSDRPEEGAGNIRVWDIEHGFEMVRYRYDEDFCGVDGNGDVVSNLKNSRSAKAGYFDSHSGKLKKIRLAGRSTDHMLLINAVRPTYGVEVKLGQKGKGKGAAETLYEGIFHNGIITRKDKITHIQPTSTGVFANLRNYQLWQSEPESMAGTHLLLEIGWVHRWIPRPVFGSNPTLPIDDWRRVSNFTGLLGMSDGSIGSVVQSPPVFMSGTREYLILTNITRGPGEGLWMQLFDITFEKELFRKKISGPEQWTAIGMIMHKGWPIFDILPTSSNDKFAFVEGRYLYYIKVGAREVEQHLLPEGYPTINAFQVYLSASNSILCYGTQFTDGKWNTTFFQLFIDKYLQIEPTLAEICARVCEDCGLTADEYDVSDLAGFKVGGYLHDNPAPGRQVIEDLATVYLFDVAEIDYKLVFRRRGREAAVTIPQRKLGVVGDEQENSIYSETRTQESELAQTVVVNYIDVKDDYKTKSQHYRRPRSPKLGMLSEEMVDINLPIPLKPDMAKQLAEKILFSSWAERTTRDYVLPWDYLIYDATDVIRIELDDGLSFNDRVLKFDVGADLSLDVSAVSEYAPSYTSEGIGVVSGGRIDRGRTGAPGVAPLVLDIPYLDDDDRQEVGSQLPYYWGAVPNKAGFRFASLSVSRSGGDAKSGGTTLTEAVAGIVMGDVPPPPHGPFATDDKTVIKLLPAFDYEASERYEWESVPKETWPTYENMIWIDGEVILFRDVAVQDDGTVLISHLIRGHRGTEAWAKEHPGGSRWCLLNNTGIQLSSLPVEALNEEIVARIASPSLLQILQPYEEFYFRANGIRPYAPSDIRRKDNDDGSVTFSWQRRTRFGGEMRDASSIVPLNEEREAYTLLILSEPVEDPSAIDPVNLPDTVKRKLETATSSVTYELQDQIADGLAGKPLHILLFQQSDIAGLGLPAMETLPKVVQPYRV